MVIQRWQSVLLLIATILMGCFTFFSLGQIQGTEFTYNFTALGFTSEGIPTDSAAEGEVIRTWELFIVSLMSAVLPFISIFLFKNFKAQIRLCTIELMFIIVTSVLAVKRGYDFANGADLEWTTWIIAAPVSLIAVIAALRCIKSDRRKLMSVDRLR